MELEKYYTFKLIKPGIDKIGTTLTSPLNAMKHYYIETWAKAGNVDKEVIKQCKKAGAIDYFKNYLKYSCFDLIQNSPKNSLFKVFQYSITGDMKTKKVISNLQNIIEVFDPQRMVLNICCKNVDAFPDEECVKVRQSIPLTREKSPYITLSMESIKRNAIYMYVMIIEDNH